MNNYIKNVDGSEMNAVLIKVWFPPSTRLVSQYYYKAGTTRCLCVRSNQVSQYYWFPSLVRVCFVSLIYVKMVFISPSQNSGELQGITANISIGQNKYIYDCIILYFHDHNGYHTVNPYLCQNIGNYNNIVCLTTYSIHGAFSAYFDRTVNMHFCVCISLLLVWCTADRQWEYC